MFDYKKFLLIGISAAVFSSNADASGYQLNEYSATGLGRAFAGSGVVGDDYSAVAFNPAGMNLKDSGGQMGISTVQMHSIVEGKLHDNVYHQQLPDYPEGKMDFYKVLPSAFGQYRVNDKAVIGGGIYTPFGLASIYNSDWFGSSHGISTELEVVDFALGGAYKATDTLSVGATLIYRYVHGDIINSLPYQPQSRNQMDLDGWEWAYNFGVMYEPIKDTRFGIAYRLNSAHKVTGKNRIKRAQGPLAALNGSRDGVSKMTLPNQLTLSAYHKLNGSFGISGTARWTKWDIFDNFVMTSPVVEAVIPENWKNVWTYSLGVDYYYSEQWTLRTGISYDPTPIRSAKYRTARIPDSDRLWTTLGVSYQTDNWQFDVGYAHLFMRTAKSHNSDNYTTLNARHRNYSNMLGVQFQYNF
ncbi:MAG: outer membrane protein transport protein [Alphaproteobacteria bacterium]|nr:outer membrane protein transport protein [Alphaproteobacteria bacterium]